MAKLVMTNVPNPFNKGSDGYVRPTLEVRNGEEVCVRLPDGTELLLCGFGSGHGAFLTLRGPEGYQPDPSKATRRLIVNRDNPCLGEIVHAR